MTQSSTCPGSLVANVSMPWQVLPPLAPRKMPPKARDSTRPNPGPSARESASNRCVFVVSALAGIVLKLPRVSYPAKASAACE
jgi:hypothetical protein